LEKIAKKCNERLNSRNDMEREEDSFQTEAAVYQAQA
jgi:hypothetical protein